MARFEENREQRERRSAVGRWEVITVRFTRANTDTIIKHNLPAPKPEMVDYEVIRTNSPGSVYHDGSSTRRPWGDGFIVLRCDAAPIVADIRLTVSAERTIIRPVPKGAVVVAVGNADTLDGLDSTDFALASHSHDLDDLNDVSLGGVSDGDVLTYHAGPGTWQADPPAAASLDLDDLGDVNAPSPADGDVLTWDNGAGEWVGAAPAVAASSLALFFAAGASGGHSPADGQTYLFGMQPGFNPNTAVIGFEVVAPFTGTIARAYGAFIVAGTLGSAQNVTVRIRNLTTATTEDITTTLQMTAAVSSFNNTALTLAVTAGDRLHIQVVTPTWVTNPTAVIYNVTVILSI